MRFLAEELFETEIGEGIDVALFHGVLAQNEREAMKSICKSTEISDAGKTMQPLLRNYSDTPPSVLLRYLFTNYALLLLLFHYFLAL
jgi:hypothetical protein